MNHAIFNFDIDYCIFPNKMLYDWFYWTKLDNCGQNNLLQLSQNFAALRKAFVFNLTKMIHWRLKYFAIIHRAKSKSKCWHDYLSASFGRDYLVANNRNNLWPYLIAINGVNSSDSISHVSDFREVGLRPSYTERWMMHHIAGFSCYFIE